MSVGNAKIDNDHKYLISIINTIEAALEIEAPARVLSDYVSQLIDFSHQHFKREEGYQVEINFPNRTPHKKLHKDMMGQIQHIHKNLLSQADQYHTFSGAYMFTTPLLLDTLQDWMMNHFMHEDLKMKEYFEAL
jgi:hemerythrin-like metal-binding protein